MWSMRLPTAERIKREDIPRAVVLALAGRPTSRPSCFGRNAPAAAALFFLSLSLPLYVPDSSNILASLHFSYPVLCTRLGLFLSLHLPLSSAGRQAGRLHSYSPLYPSPYPPSVLPVCPATSLLAFELSRDLELSSRIGTRDALRVSFLIPLTLALFSLSLPLFPTRFVAINIRRDVIFNSVSRPTCTCVVK